MVVASPTTNTFKARLGKPTYCSPVKTLEVVIQLSLVIKLEFFFKLETRIQKID